MTSLAASPAAPAPAGGALAGTTPQFSVTTDVGDDGALLLRFTGRLTLEDGRSLWTSLGALLAEVNGARSVRFDLSDVERIDGGAMALLVHAKGELEARGAAVEVLAGDPRVTDLVHLYSGDVVLKRLPRPPSEPILAQIGGATVDILSEVGAALGFVGNVLLSTWRIARAPATGNFSEVAPIIARAGGDAVPIVALINFLIGFVMAFQGAVQLKQFGANIFVADLVGLSVTRELGPLMTAIILSGRTGAAFAAELGSMRVSQETDALRTLGFDPLRFLVFPRVVGLMLVAPILTMLADTVGVIGGLIVGCVSLDLTVTAYLTETKSALSVWDVTSGLLKSVVFALAIGAIACQQGLAASGGASGVGRRTTSAVVSTLFALILIDALFTVVFHAYGI